MQKICIWTPDKDLSQCVRDDFVVQVDRKRKIIRDAAGVRAKFGVPPELIPDYLALVGDAADGYPGIPGIGSKGAAALLSRYGRIEEFPAQVLGERGELALLFKTLATLRSDAALFTDVDELKWRGPTGTFAAAAGRFNAPGLQARADKAHSGFLKRNPYPCVPRHWEPLHWSLLQHRSVAASSLTSVRACVLDERTCRRMC